MDKYRVPRKIIAQRYKRISNIAAERDVRTGKDIMRLPGLSFTHFTRTGVPTAYSIGKMLEIGRMSLKYNDDFIGKGKDPPTNDSNQFQNVVLGQSVTISPEFHQRARIVFPMIQSSSLVHVGNSTWSMDNVVTDAEIGDILISSTKTLARMNISTGRPVRIPEEMRERLTKNLQNGQNKRVAIMKDFPDKPAACFKRTIQVRHSDTDWLYHTNQASYFDFCMDVATEGAKLGHFRLLTGDLLSYRIELMECLYKGESLPGDKLDVSVWENVDNPSQLFSQIEKEGRVIWIGRLAFRLGLDSKL